MWFSSKKKVQSIVKALEGASKPPNRVLGEGQASYPIQEGPLKTITFPLREGLSGNRETIDVMKALARMRAAHPRVRAFALTILQGAQVPSHFYLSEARCLASFVHAHMRYVRDPIGIEQLTDPLTYVDQLERGLTPQGDCDDMALLIATLLLAVGQRPVFRAVRYDGNSGNYNHIYVWVRASDLGRKPERLVCDAIVKEKPIGYEIPHASGADYPVD
jgi:hypothetical protein